MARQSTLEAVYAAIHVLKNRGDTLTAQGVAEVAGVSRATLYQDDTDWRNVLEMIDGSRPVPLLAADVPKMAPPAARRYAGLARRVGEMEASVAELSRVVDVSHQQLLGQLQKYASQGQLVPKNKRELLALRRELARYEQRAKELQADNDRLAKESSNSNVVALKGLKRVITLSRGLAIPESVKELQESLDGMFPMRSFATNTDSVTLVAGLPRSGKSCWIGAASPSSVGVSLFIEGGFHTLESRLSTLRTLRARGALKVGCAWLTTSADTCLERAYLESDDDSVPDAIELMVGELEMVSVNEPFDFIFGVSGAS